MSIIPVPVLIFFFKLFNQVRCQEYYTQEIIKVRGGHAGRVFHRHVLLTTSLTPLTELVLRYTPQILTFPNSYQRTGIFPSFRLIFLDFSPPRSLVVTILLKVTINTNKIKLKCSILLLQGSHKCIPYMTNYGKYILTCLHLTRGSVG